MTGTESPTSARIPKLTCGRHCSCSACAREDWTRPELAPCGMHGESCPNVYDPYSKRVIALRDALSRAIEVIEWSGLNDRSAPYEYGECRRDGTAPPPGATFNTPREFANYWPEVLVEAFDV